MYQSKRKGFSRGLDRLLSTPSLMKGEDENVYAELYARVEEVAQPQDAWEQMMVADVVNHFWEQQRYRRCTGTIINSERRSALKKLLRDAVGLNPADATEVADLYFGVIRYEDDRRTFYSDPAEIPKTRAEVIAMLKKHGFTETDIDRVAMESSIGALANLENLALKHEFRREAILCELEGRRERRAQRQPPTASRQLNGGGRAPAKDLSHESSPPLIEPSP
jgi:hypothetical protein